MFWEIGAVFWVWRPPDWRYASLDNKSLSVCLSVCGPFSFTEGFDLVSPNFSVLILLVHVYYLYVVAHNSNLSTWQAEAARSLTDCWRPVWFT